MRVPMGDPAQYGVIRDVKDYRLPPNAWTDSRMVRFQDGALIRMPGHLEALQGCPIQPYWGMHVFDTAKQSHWIIAGLGKVYEYSSGIYTEITKLATTYTATATELWNGGVLGNIPVINNAHEKPQMWAPVNSAQRLVDLSNWPATHVAAVVRPFKNFLFALDITEGGVRFQHRVRVSHPAVPGAVPSSWDDTDPTKDVYVNDLSDFGQGPLLDCLPMRDVNILYKERSTWGMQFVGGRAKWRLFSILEESGILDTNCAVQFAENSQHFVCTGEDIIYHNGQSPTSILTKRERKWLLQNMDTANFNKSFAVHNMQEGECWFCFPLSGSSDVNFAVVWNYRENLTYFRPLDIYSFIATGQIPSISSDPWDADMGSWDSDLTPWDQFTHPSYIRRLLAFKPSSSKLFHMDFTEQADGVNFDAYVERTGLDVIGANSQGEAMRDRERMRLIRRVFMNAEGAPFEVWIATQQEQEGAFSWSNEGTFTPGIDKFIDVGKSTLLWGIRFRSISNASWRINGFEPDIEPLGDY